MHAFNSTPRFSRYLLLFLLLHISRTTFSQNQPTLTVEKIMQDTKWMGTSPSGLYWSRDGKYLFFGWNPDKAPGDSLYYITREDPSPHRASFSLEDNSIPAGSVRYNTTRTAYVYSKDGDIFWGDVKTGREKRVTHTNASENNPVFAFHDTRVVYTRDGNLYSWEITGGETDQLTNFTHNTEARPAEPAARPRARGGDNPPTAARDEKKDDGNAQEKWLQKDQLEYFQVLKERKEKRDQTDSINKLHIPKEVKEIAIDERQLSALVISPDGRFITYRLMKRPAGARNTIVPNYVTYSGFTEDIPGRTKVGAPEGSYSFYVFDTEKDTAIEVKTDQIPGITDLPDYVKDYPAPAKAKDSTRSGRGHSRTDSLRSVVFNGPHWSEGGTHAVVEVFSQDHKDRWLLLLDPATGKLSPLDRQRDEAWVGGPGIAFFGFGAEANQGWIDENTYWFHSEASGYSHLYTVNVNTGVKTQLTHGNYEVQQVALSGDKKHFYITTNEVHPGEQQFYQLPVTGGKAVRITTLTGANQVTISPDEKQLAILYSYSNKPWELYLQENKAGSQPRQITNKAMSDEFKAYPWKDPAIITFTARDGATVYARLYRPANPAASHPAVIFVHGAGYLQNAHKWWSSYFHEYMFNNLLADKGYTVLDMDYRGSAGYGRDWRTGIYRHMGGKDLTDEVDGAKWLTEHEGVDARHIGLYGGSYGGFITLMALFTQPDVFAAGAGLRSVTDWASYNHGYTSNILNEPFTDSLAYRRSSPLYFAEGLKGHLLMCHGMVDENVHFQDIVRLTQRLIELHKDNWELAAYPMEDHGFVEPSSWTDEYKRILKLFETWLK